MSESRRSVQESIIIGQCNSDSIETMRNFDSLNTMIPPHRFYYSQVRSSFVYPLFVRSFNCLERDRNPNTYGISYKSQKRYLTKKKETYLEELTFSQQDVSGRNFTVCKQLK